MDTKQRCRNCGKLLPAAGCVMNPEGHGQGQDWHHPPDQIEDVQIVPVNP